MRNLQTNGKQKPCENKSLHVIWSTEVQKKREERVTNLEFVYYMSLNIPGFC